MGCHLPCSVVSLATLLTTSGHAALTQHSVYNNYFPSKPLQSRFNLRRACDFLKLFWWARPRPPSKSMFYTLSKLRQHFVKPYTYYL